jgi:hypothetical protein
MTTLTLPNEIINKIFSYIEGKHNQIIKKELINSNTFWSNRDESTYNSIYNSTYNIKFAFDILKYNLICKMLFNNKVIKYNTYFKYSILHLNRQYVFDDIKFGLRALIDDFNYYNKYYNYTKILREVRKNYIDDYNYQYKLTNRQLKTQYDTYFKYTILHENRKKVFNNIKRYEFKKHYIFNKKLSNKILLERGILINYIQKDNNKRQKKWN